MEIGRAVAGVRRRGALLPVGAVTCTAVVPRWLLLLVCGLGLAGGGVWGRSAALRLRSLRRLRSLTDEPDINMLATGALARDVHSAGLYLVIAVASGFAAAAHPDHEAAWWALCLIAVPVVASLALARYAKRDALLSDKRVSIEHRAVELLQQADAAPNRWAERLAPNTLPPTPGYSVGHVRQAGTGVMSGDLLDVYHLPSGRLCCVVGDVSGHDVEASITALQTKFLLRSYLRRYRDPGQALEELNRQLVDYERPEEFVSLFVVVFDTEAGTLRYASAGHPSVWLCQDHHVRPLRSTGPLLMLDGEATYLSREESVSAGDVVVMFTDGLVEARSGQQFFGEERVAAAVRRASEVEPAVLCRQLLDAATEFAGGRITDDVTVLAVKRVDDD